MIFEYTVYGKPFLDFISWEDEEFLRGIVRNVDLQRRNY